MAQPNPNCSMIGEVPHNTDNCAICSTPVLSHEEKQILSCGHICHAECLDKHLKEESFNCPVCETPHS